MTIVIINESFLSSVSCELVSGITEMSNDHFKATSNESASVMDGIHPQLTISVSEYHDTSPSQSPLNNSTNNQSSRKKNKLSQLEKLFRDFDKGLIAQCKLSLGTPPLLYQYMPFNRSFD